MKSAALVIFSLFWNTLFFGNKICGASYGCLGGMACLQCPVSAISQKYTGRLICCQDCTQKCYCLNDVIVKSKSIAFPEKIPEENIFYFGEYLPNTEGRIIRPSSPGSFMSRPLEPPSEEYITSESPELLPFKKALSLMAIAIEDLTFRVEKLERRLEEQLGDTRPSSSQAEAVSIHPTEPQRKCKNVNFTAIGGGCYYFSSQNRYSAIWEEAKKFCEGMSAKLIEPDSVGTFSYVSSYLASNVATSGGIFPGVFWIWAHTAMTVSQHPWFWEENGNSRPGDFVSGKCLLFKYSSSKHSYLFSAEGCGYNKYFACELLETEF